MLKILLSLIPAQTPAYLVLNANTKARLGVLRPEFAAKVRYTFVRNDGGERVTGEQIETVLETALHQSVEIEITTPQDLIHS